MQPSGDEQHYQQPNEQATGAPYQATATDAAVPPEPAAVPADSQNTQTDPAATPHEDDDAVLRWDGPEYITHDHNPRWYIILGVVTLALMAAAIFLFDSITFAILIPVMTAALVVYTRRGPQTITYTVSRQGIHVGEKLYPYDAFKSFAVSSHGGHHSVILVPRKRFQMALTAYFPEEVGEPLVDMLAARLPMQTHTPDFMDKLLAKLGM